MKTAPEEQDLQTKSEDLRLQQEINSRLGGMTSKFSRKHTVKVSEAKEGDDLVFNMEGLDDLIASVQRRMYEDIKMRFQKKSEID